MENAVSSRSEQPSEIIKAILTPSVSAVSGSNAAVSCCASVMRGAASHSSCCQPPFARLRPTTQKSTLPLSLQGWYKVKHSSAAEAHPPSLMSMIVLYTPLPPSTLVICHLLLLTAHSFAASFHSDCGSQSSSALLPCFKNASRLQRRLITNTEQRELMCLENTSERKSATAEQKRCGAALISALLKPAAIVKLSFSVFFYPSHLFSLPLKHSSSPTPHLPRSPHHPPLSVSQGSGFLSPSPPRVQWLTAQYASIIHGRALRFAGKTNHRWSHR